MAFIEVQAPDGSIIEFPAGTDDATIDRVMRENFAPQAVQQAPAEPQGQGYGNNLAQAAGDGVFFGFGDEISARLNAMTGYDANTGTYGNWGTTYDDQLAAVRGQEKQFREDHPVASFGAEFAGAMLPAAVGVGAVGQGANIWSKIGRGAAAGGAMGAAYGFGEGEGGVGGRVENARNNGLIGLAAGAAIPAVGGVIGSAARGRAARKAVREAARNAPSTEELRAIGNSLYRQIDDAGVQIKPGAFDDLRGSVLDYLRANTGFDELPGPGSLTPGTARVMEIMDQAGQRMAQDPTAALPFRSLDQMRRQAGAAAGNVTNRTDKAAGSAVIQQLDDFVQRLSPDDVVAGNVDSLQSAIPQARDVWSRMTKSQLVDDAMERSENYLSGSASGVRNQFKNLLQNKKIASGFNAAEKAALRQVTHGSPIDQIVNLAGSGLAQMGVIGGGLQTGGFGGGVIGALMASGQRKLAESVTMRNAELARAAIASGKLKNQAIIDALIGSGQQAERLTTTGLLGMLPVLSSEMTKP